MLKYILTTLILVTLQLHSFAGFVLSGTLIIQSGTDLNLSAIAGIAGVTSSTVSNGGSIYTSYNINNLRLRIDGNLTINPEIEVILCGATSGRPYFDVINGGTLTIGRQRTLVATGGVTYSTGMAIYFSHDNSFCCGAGNASLVVRSGGTLNWYGGEISIGGPLIELFAGSIINIFSKKAQLTWRNSDVSNQLRWFTTAGTVDGFTMVGGDITFVGLPLKFEGYNPILAQGAIAFSGSTPNIDFPIRGYEGGVNQNEKDIKLWSGGRPVLTNSLTGSKLNCGSHIPGNTASYGVARIYQDVNFKITDPIGNPIDGVRFTMTDNNNGNRENYTAEAPSISLLNDFSYTGISDITGSIPTQTILLAGNIVNNGNANGPNIGNYAWDYRGKDNASTDKFDFYFIGYSTLFSSSVEILKGSDTLEIQVKVLQDVYISEPDTNVVLAYTGIGIDHTNRDVNITNSVYLEQIYDYIKNDKVNRNILLPSVDTLIGEGDLLTFKLKSNYSLSIDGDTIDINPSSDYKFNKILTTDSVIFTNGGFLRTGYEDATGEYKYLKVSNIKDSSVITIVDSNSFPLDTIYHDTLFAGGSFEYHVKKDSANPKYYVNITKKGQIDWRALLAAVNLNEIFCYEAFQVDAALHENQDTIIQLCLKLLQKTEAVKNTYMRTVQPNLNVTTNVVTVSNYGTLENQEEIIRLLLFTLRNTAITRESVNSGK